MLEAGRKTMNSLLKQERLNRHWSRAKIEKLTGIPQRSLENWEEGIAFPREENIRLLCKLYGKSRKQLGLGKARESHDIMGAVDTIPMSEEETPMSDIMRRAFFSDLGSRLSSLVNQWPRRNLDYQDLQAEIHRAITEYNVVVEYDSTAAVTRRDTCKSLMLIPLRLCGLDAVMSAVLPKIPKDTEGLLLHTAAGIAGAWYMRRTKDIHLAYEAVSYYIPILESVLQSSSSEKCRKAAATLLIQCFGLKGSLTFAIDNGDPIPYYDKAMECACLVGASREQAIVHREIATWFWHKEDHSQSLIHAEQAYHSARNAESIIQSYALSSLMICQAATGNTDEACSSLGKAQSLFDPSNLSITIQYSSSILAMCAATTQYHLGNYEEAATLYTHSIESPDTSALGKVQACIERARVEVSRDDEPRDMGLAVNYWEQGITGAKELGSERFIKEARKAYPLLVAAWPTEDAVKRLRKQYL
jgi:transcriptional regulator with XRE-family HTH domain